MPLRPLLSRRSRTAAMQNIIDERQKRVQQRQEAEEARPGAAHVRLLPVPTAAASKPHAQDEPAGALDPRWVRARQ